MLSDHEKRALPPGTSSQDIITAILARLDALEKENEELKRRLVTLENQ